MWPAAKFSNGDFLFPLSLLYLFIGILLQERVVSSPFIYLWTYFVVSVWLMNIYFILWIITLSLLCYPNCSKCGHWDRFQHGSCPSDTPRPLKESTSLLWALQGSPGSFWVLLAPAMDSTTPPKPKSPRPGHLVRSLLPGRHSSQRTELRNIYIPPTAYTHVYLFLYISLCILFLKHHNVHSSLPPFLSCNFPLIVRKLALFIANKSVQP